MLDSEIEIREIEEQNIPETSSVYIKAFNNANLGEQWTNQSAQTFIEYWFKTQPDLFLIATQKDKIIGGVVGGIKPWWDGLHLVDCELFVDPDFQKMGIATQLMKKILSLAIEKYQITEVEGVVDGNSDFPINWYEKMGIKETGLAHISGNAQEILHHLEG